jgi:predicted ribosome quality control (RQC) complex YloA/Tae2 family protein
MKIESIFDSKIGQDVFYWVGQHAQDNWDMLDKAEQNDIWFHLDNCPSSHVILKISNLDKKSKKVSKQTLIHCAQQCKLHSKFSEISSNKHKIKVIYTEVKNVSKADKVGSVYTKKTDSLLI